jgi:hypothetical protein
VVVDFLLVLLCETGDLRAGPSLFGGEFSAKSLNFSAAFAQVFDWSNGLSGGTAISSFGAFQSLLLRRYLGFSRRDSLF